MSIRNNNRSQAWRRAIIEILAEPGVHTADSITERFRIYPGMRFMIRTQLWLLHQEGLVRKRAVTTSGQAKTTYAYTMDNPPEDVWPEPAHSPMPSEQCVTFEQIRGDRCTKYADHDGPHDFPLS